MCAEIDAEYVPCLCEMGVHDAPNSRVCLCLYSFCGANSILARFSVAAMRLLCVLVARERGACAVCCRVTWSLM